MADKPPVPKVKGKPPKWVIPVGIAAVLAAFIVMKKRKPASSGNATEPGTQGLSNQSFIPVTGENVAGVGAGTYPGTGETGGNAALVQFLKEQNEEAKTNRREEKVEGREAIEREQAFYNGILSNLGTGGGAPTAGGAPGITTAPPPEAATPPTPTPVSPPPPTPSAKCPSSFPDYNPAAGPVGPHSCYKYSRDRCSSKATPYKHVYQDGHIVCSPT